jgi:hypothetical protein
LVRCFSAKMQYDWKIIKNHQNPLKSYCFLGYKVSKNDFQIKTIKLRDTFLAQTHLFSTFKVCTRIACLFSKPMGSLANFRRWTLFIIYLSYKILKQYFYIKIITLHQTITWLCHCLIKRLIHITPNNHLIMSLFDLCSKHLNLSDSSPTYFYIIYIFSVYSKTFVSIQCTKTMFAMRTSF